MVGSVRPLLQAPAGPSATLEQEQLLASSLIVGGSAVAPRPVELLIVGGESDPNTRRVADQAAMRGVDFAMVDTDTEAASNIQWSFDDPAILFGDAWFAPDSLFLRHNVFSPAGGLQTQPAANAAHVHHIAREYAQAWPQIRILNRRVLGNMNSKSANLAMAKRLGFVVPESHVMTANAPTPVGFDMDQAIAKPLLGGAHTQHAADFVTAAQDPAAAASMPPQFLQHRVDGHNLRVFVVGGQTFAFHIDSDLLDYREEVANAVHNIETPPHLVEPCVAMADEIGFDYCAFDFRGTEGFDGLHFLEVNSFPMFVRFDMECENRLVDKMLSVLLKREIYEPNQ